MASLKTKLLAAVTIAVLSSSAAMAEYTVSELKVIEALVTSGDWADLREYLAANPEILQGDDAFASEMRGFLASYKDSSFLRLFNPPEAPNASLIAQLVEQY